MEAPMHPQHVWSPSDEGKLHGMNLNFVESVSFWSVALVGIKVSHITLQLL